MTLQEAQEEYLGWKGTYAEAAAKDYALPLQRLGGFLKRDLEEITQEDIINFQVHLKNNYNVPTANYTMRVVRNFLEYWGIQCAKKIKIPRYTSTPHKAVKENEYKKMLEVWDRGEFWQAQKILIIRMFWETGMRVSELVSMNVLDVGNKHAEIITKKSGGKTRTIYWSNETDLMLKKYLGVRICLNQKPELFISEKRTRATTRTIERWIIDTAQRAGMEGITCHSFRHAKAMRILQMGGNVKDVQTALGHSELSPIVSFHYLRSFSKAEEQHRLAQFL